MGTNLGLLSKLVYKKLELSLGSLEMECFHSQSAKLEKWSMRDTLGGTTTFCMKPGGFQQSSKNPISLTLETVNFGEFSFLLSSCSQLLMYKVHTNVTKDGMSTLNCPQE